MCLIKTVTRDISQNVLRITNLGNLTLCLLMPLKQHVSLYPQMINMKFNSNSSLLNVIIKYCVTVLFKNNYTVYNNTDLVIRIMKESLLRINLSYLFNSNRKGYAKDVFL